MIKVVLNNKQFLQLLNANNTKASIYYIKQKFIKYIYNLDIYDLIKLS
jgi:hypothetical protein